MDSRESAGGRSAIRQGVIGKVCAMSTHVSWGSIELLHNAVRTRTHLAEQGHPFPVVTYRAKVKLHGTNCAVQITEQDVSSGQESVVVAQSRTMLLSPEADYKGFAAWTHAHAAFWRARPHGLVVFGEWCGPGVEKGMAISRATTKLFCVFAVQAADHMVTEPAAIAALLAPNAPPELHVLPWEGDPITIDFGSRESLDQAAQVLSDRVAEIEREDPWCKRVLGISGLGEGLVLYPTWPTPHDPTLMFKAKGEKHRTAGTKAAVTVDPAIAASIDEFVALMVTGARLEQGLAATCGGTRDPKRTGAFLAWIADDVRKESVAELEASQLTWTQVEKAVQTRARNWFLKGGA
jgi:hypothetical protein